MKNVLLTSTALVAFAGAAAADGHASVSHALGGVLGYNNEAGDEHGFYWEGNLKTTATAALDNGLTAGAYFEVTVAGDDGTSANDGGQAFVGSDFVLSLTAGDTGLYFGDTKAAAETHWVSAGDMETDGFSNSSDAAVLRGDIAIAGFKTSLSYIANDAANTAEQLSVGASGAFGAFTVAAAYQAEVTSGFDADGADGDFNAAEIVGVSVGGTFVGATVTAAYSSNLTTEATSAGVALSYPFGPVTANAYYVMETGAAGVDADANYGVGVKYEANGIMVAAAYRDEQGRTEYNVDASYDLGNGLKVIGGALNEDEVDVDYYVGAMYDLGGGAAVKMTYAADENNDQGDEIGSGDHERGITVEVSFTF